MSRDVEMVRVVRCVELARALPLPDLKVTVRGLERALAPSFSDTFGVRGVAKASSSTLSCFLEASLTVKTVLVSGWASALVVSSVVAKPESNDVPEISVNA